MMLHCRVLVELNHAGYIKLSRQSLEKALERATTQGNTQKDKLLRQESAHNLQLFFWFWPSVEHAQRLAICSQPNLNYSQIHSTLTPRAIILRFTDLPCSAMPLHYHLAN